MLVTPTPRPTDVTALCAPCPTGPPPSLLRCCWTRAALAAAFDGADVTELAVYAIGDGAALSGVLIAARREPGATVVLVFLLD